MRGWRKKQKWQVIAALLFAVWILMGTRKINVNAENMEAESFTGETAVETEEETTEKTVTAGIGYRAASADSEGITEQLVSDMSFEQVQTLMDEMLGEDSFSIGTALKNMINGETVFSKEAVQQFLRSLFFERLEKERANFFRILLLVLAAAVFSNFAEVFENSQIGEVSFYMVYLLLFTILMNSYQQLGVSLGKQLEWMTQFMKGLAPAYFVAVSAASGAVTASVFYQGVLLLVWLIQWILLNVLLPAAEIYVLLRLVNHLSREEMLGKFAEFLKTVVSWALKTLLGLVAGLQVVRGLVAPVMDSLKRSVIGKAAGALPGVGNAVNMVTELVITSAVLVRNCLGVLILLATVAAGAGPVIHYGMLSLTYRFLAAVSQPVSDKRMVECLSTMGEGFEILLKILFTAEVLCILTFLIIMAGIQGGGG